MKTTKISKFRLKCLKWALNTFTRIVDSKDLSNTHNILLSLTTEVEVKRANWIEFRKNTNRGKSIHEVLCTKEPLELISIEYKKH